MRIWVDRFGSPCDSLRHDAQPLEVVPESEVKELREFAEWARERGRAKDDTILVNQARRALGEQP